MEAKRLDHPEPLIKTISDTARWAAYYRARESERPDAVFQDPFAQRFAIGKGEQIAAGLSRADETTWAWVTRTWLFDRLIRERIESGVDLVVNLAAGFDARPYRMDLPARLRWVEVDLDEPLAYKEERLRDEKAVCKLERIRLDLSQHEARRRLFSELGKDAEKALVVTEGLLIYFPTEAVGELARDLAELRSYKYWVTDLASPGLLRMIQKQWGGVLTEAGARVLFAPPEGPPFFLQYGWKPTEVHSSLKTAAGLRRLSFWMRLMALLPESKTAQGRRPWSATVLLERVS